MKKEEKDLEKEIKEEVRESKEDINSLLETIKLLTEQNEALNDKILRVSAELQNYRKRKDEEVDRLIKYSEEKLILEILPVVDNFERAILLDDENLSDEVSKFLQGFKIIYSNLVNILNKFDVKEIEALDKEFDPNYHQAVLAESVEEKENNVVLEVLQKGYIYKDKVIRPSMVRVNNK